MAEKTIDYGADVMPETADNLLAKIDALANLTLDAEAEIDAAEDVLKKAQERHRDLVERQLPEAMETARQKALVTYSNAAVALKDKIRASIPKDVTNRKKAFDWLRNRGHGAIIKSTVAVPFEAGRDPAAEALQAFLMALSTDELFRDRILHSTREYRDDAVKMEPLWSFLQAIGNDAEHRIFLEETVHAQTLMALIRELLTKGQIDQPGLDTLGAYAWKEAEVKRKD